MLIIPWIENVGKAFQAGGDVKILVSVRNPMQLALFLQEFYDPKRHQAAALFRYFDSPFAYFIMNAQDYPMCDMMDPKTGKYWIKYSEEDPYNRMVRIE